MAIIQMVPIGRKKIAKLLDAATTTKVSDMAALSEGKSTIQATITGTGAVSASVNIEFSNDGVGWVAAGPSPVISLSGTTTDSDGFAVDADWVYIRATLTAISGTGAAVTVTVVI